MNTPKPEKNGAGKPNLTYQQHLVTNHTGLDSLPGFVVVVFERLKGGGARFLRSINPGEIFKNFNFIFWDSPQNYFAIAVNQSTLRYAFDEPVILDDNVHKFTLIFHLTYRAYNPRMVADLASQDQDPLQRLRHEIARTLVRTCAQRNWEMIRTRFRELELIALNAEQARLQQFASTLGIEIVNIELDRRLPHEEVKADLKAEEIGREIRIAQLTEELNRVRGELQTATARQSELSQLDHQHDLHRRELDNKRLVQDEEHMIHRGEQYQKLLDRLDGSISKALDGVADQINTPDGLMEAFDALRSIHASIKSDQAALAGQAGFAAAGFAPGLSPGSFSPQMIGAGEDKVVGLLIQAFREIAQLKLTSAQKRTLTSYVLHITAEALLDDAADEEVLKKYGEKLITLASGFELSKKQYQEFHRFQDYEQLRNDLR